MSPMHEASGSSDFLDLFINFILLSRYSSTSSSSCYPWTSPRWSNAISCATSPRRWGQLTSISPTQVWQDRRVHAHFHWCKYSVFGTDTLITASSLHTTHFIVSLFSGCRTVVGKDRAHSRWSFSHRYWFRLCPSTRRLWAQTGVRCVRRWRISRVAKENKGGVDRQAPQRRKDVVLGRRIGAEDV